MRFQGPKQRGKNLKKNTNMWLIRKAAIIAFTAVNIECTSEITISLVHPLENTLWWYLTDPMHFCTQLLC